MVSVNERLAWRYATKKFDLTRSVPAETVDGILEAVRLAPTSSGLQPFEVFVVSNRSALPPHDHRDGLMLCRRATALMDSSPE